MKRLQETKRLMNVNAVRQLFPGLLNRIYMNTATMAIGNLPARRAYEKALTNWTEGTFDYQEAEQAGEKVRSLFSSFIGASMEEVALVPAVSTAAGIVAAQFSQAKSGENILVADFEFSSNFYPWVLLRNLGYEIRIVKSNEGMILSDAFDAAADSRTRLIAISAVQSSSGFRANLYEISQIAHQSNAWFFVDGCQAVGAVPLDVNRDGIDLLATSSHKFLLGTRGMGYLYVKRDLIDRFKPVLPGWKAARQPLESFYGPNMELSVTASKLDTSLSWFAALAEQASLKIIKRIGLNEILKRNENLTQHLYQAFADRDVRIKTFPRENRSTIHSVPIKDAGRIGESFKSNNIVASARGEKLRLALHFFNSEEEINIVADIVAEQ